MSARSTGMQLRPHVLPDEEICLCRRADQKTRSHLHAVPLGHALGQLVGLDTEDTSNELRALRIAVRQYHNGQLEALAWVAAGMPQRIAQEDIRVYQAARGIIQENGGKLKPGDERRLAARIARAEGDCE